MDNKEEKRIEEMQKLLVVNRIRILKLLYQEDTCVCQMVEKLDMKHNLISHHLKTLIDLGYLTNNRNGQHIMYSLVKDKKMIVSKLLTIINK